MVEPSEGTEKEKSDTESGPVKGSSQRRAEDELLRVKDSLERSEGRLRAIVDSAVDGIITIDEQGRIESFNPAAERLFGYASAEVLGQNVNMLMPAPHREQHDGYLSAYLQTGVPKIIGIGREVVGFRKDGSTFPMMLSVSEVRLPEGRLFTGIVHDRTARRQVEEQRDRIFNLSLDLLGIANTDGYFKRVNPAFSQVLGWSEDEILSRPFMDFVHPDDREATLREVEKLASGQPTLHFENRYQCKDGSWRWLAWKTMPQVDGLLYATGRDVTELKQAEASLRESEENLAITLNSIGDAVLATDVQRRITSMNPIAEKLTGWPLAEALGRPVDEVFYIINEETRQPAVIPVDDVLRTGEIHGLANHTILIARDGTEHPIADSAAAIRDQVGNIRGVVLVFRDATGERRAEQALHTLNSELEQRVAERTATLAASEERFRLLVDSVKDYAIFMLDPEGRVASWNAGAERNKGYRASEIIGQDFSCFYLPEDIARGKPQQKLKMALAEGRAEDEGWRVRKDGSRFWANAVIAPLRDASGNLRGFSKVTRDITHRKQTEDALRVISMELTNLTGAAFFETVVRRLANLLNVDWAFVCHWSPVQPDVYHTLALLEDGKILPNFSYPIVGTPCAAVPEHRSLIVAQGVQKQFPADVFLVEKGVEAYLGVLATDGAGRPIGHIGIMSRKPLVQPAQAEAVLKLFAVAVAAEMERQRSTRRFQDFFEFAPDAVVMISRDGLITLVNRQAEQMFGWGRAELVNQPVEILLPREMREGHVPLREQYFQNAAPRAMGGGRSSLKGVRKDGTKFPVEISLSPMEGEDGLLVAAAVRDVTARVQVEQASRRALATLDATSDGAFIFDPETLRFSYVNEGAVQQLGYTREELLHMTALDIKPEFNRQQFDELLALVRAQPETPYTITAVHRRKDGVDLPVEIVLQYLAPTGEPARFVAMVRDISERRQADASRLAKESAEQANRAKSEFLSRMSHELRTPLNSILGFAQMMARSQLSHRDQQRLEHILKGGKHLLDLINEVLDIARIEAGRMQISPEAICVRTVLDEVLNLIRPLAEKSQISLRLEIPSDDWYIRADNQRLKQVLLNLVSNAVKYNREFGRVTVACTEVSPDRVRLAVTDTGTGIPAENLSQLFEPFSRLGAEQTSIEGSGLGLALTKRLVDLMEGRLTVTSEVDHGSIFAVELPRSAPPASRKTLPEKVEPVPASAKARTVLYIEDNLANASLVEDILTDRPEIRLLTAQQGGLGLDLARQHHLDLIVLDVHLPDMRGDEFMKRLHADPRFQNIPVVVLSADATVNQIERLKAVGARDYLTKPIDVVRFLAVLDKIFEQDAPK